jgi:hypothetical protein
MLNVAAFGLFTRAMGPVFRSKTEALFTVPQPILETRTRNGQIEVRSSVS